MAEEVKESEDKVAKRFSANLKKMIALFQGEKALLPAKLGKDEASILVEEILKERKQKAAIAFKEEASKLLEDYTMFKREVRKAEEEMRKTVSDKKKVFSEKMEALFNKVEDLATLEKEFNENITEV